MNNSGVPDLTYSVYRISPTSPDISELVTRYRDTKLAALVAEPNGFAVKHSDEVLHSINIWRRRLEAPSNILICVASPKDENVERSDEGKLLKGEWIGMSTIRGPLEYEMFQLKESGQPVPDNPDLETRWHLCSVYTSQAHRHRGVAKMMVNASVDYARQVTKSVEQESGNYGKMKTRVRLFCHPAKVLVVKLYKDMGFQEAGNFCLKEAFVANGDPHLVPSVTGDTEESRLKWERRYGLAMEKILDT